MSHDLSVKYLDRAMYDQWDAFVDRSPQGSIYSTSYFLDALCHAVGTQFRILSVYNGEELVGGMGVHFKPGKYGDEVHTHPLLYYNGLVLKDFETKYPSLLASRQVEIMSAILTELEAGRYAFAEIASRSTLSDLRPWLQRSWNFWPRYTYVINVSDLDQQWKLVEQNLRRLITRCERDGMTLELSDDSEAFHALHAKTYQRKGVIPYIGLEQFKQLYQTLKAHNAGQIYFVRTREGVRAAGQLVLMSSHPVTHTWMAGSEIEFLRTGASAFLRWKVFEDLHQRGYAYNDLTDAMNEKVAKFKAQFGGQLEPSFVLYKDISTRLHLEKRLKGISAQAWNLVNSKLLHRRPEAVMEEE